MTNKNLILVIGSGYMATEYLKVIANTDYKAVVVGRGEEKIDILKCLFPDFIYYSGGVDKYLNTSSQIPSIAINTVNVEYLRDVTISLLNGGVKRILVEKPGDITADGLSRIEQASTINRAQVFIAYNRRFYSSVSELAKQANLDGGILSAHFEFTEWIHTIDPLHYGKETLNKWIIANSSHVIDTVFSLIGKPKSISCHISGKNIISWHPTGSIFTGSGISQQDIPFTYHSNWQAPGRWGIEVLTKKRRYYLRPMEKLCVQDLGTINIIEYPLDDKTDKQFKPGLYYQTTSFLNDSVTNLVTLQEQIKLVALLDKIGSY